MSSLVCYEISSSDEEDCNPDLQEKSDSSLNINNDVLKTPIKLELEECSDSVNLINNYKSQENILDGIQKNIQDSSSVVSIEESSNLSSPTKNIEESDISSIPTVSIEESNNISSLNDNDDNIEIVVDTRPSKLPNIDETYREHEIINISIDSINDSSSDDDDSSSLSDSDSIETFSVSDDSPNSEVESSSRNKVFNNIDQPTSANDELCSHCLNVKNNSPLESIRPLYDKSSSTVPSPKQGTNVECANGTEDTESSNMAICNDNSQERNRNDMTPCDDNNQGENGNNYDKSQEKEVDIEKVNNSQNKDYTENMEIEESIPRENILNKENEIASNSNNGTNTVCTCGKNIKENLEKKQKSKPKKKKCPFYELELPPIEDLHISVEEDEAKPIGTILHTVGNLVVVKTYHGIPAINLDSVLFLDQGKRALGRVDDVFGPIFEPHYVVRFNSPEHIKEKGIEKEEIVYFAPQTEHTNFVILRDLINMKGSDASWKDNQEPPEHFLDYSDDEEEQRARRALRAKKKNRNQTNGEVTIVKEFESQRKKVRSERPNPFSNTNYRGRSSHQTRFTASPHINSDTRSYVRRNYNSRYGDDQRNNVRFGGPPKIRSGLQSPYIPSPSPSPSLGGGPFYNSYASPSPAPSEDSGWHRFSPSPCFPTMARPSTPLPPSTYPYNNDNNNNNQAFSFSTPPPPPPSPVHFNQPSLHAPSAHSAVDLSQIIRTPPPPLVNNTPGSSQSWPQNPQNSTSFMQNSANMCNNSNYFPSENYFHSLGNVPPSNSGFQPHNQNTPPHSYQGNPPPTPNISNSPHPISPNMSNPPPPVVSNMGNPPPPFSPNNQIPFQNIPNYLPSVPPPQPQNPFHNNFN